jgi:hypothetical protein
MHVTQELDDLQVRINSLIEQYNTLCQTVSIPIVREIWISEKVRRYIHDESELLDKYEWAGCGSIGNHINEKYQGRPAKGLASRFWRECLDTVKNAPLEVFRVKEYYFAKYKLRSGEDVFLCASYAYDLRLGVVCFERSDDPSYGGGGFIGFHHDELKRCSHLLVGRDASEAERGPMKKQAIYLLHEKNQPRFKIGIAKDILCRGLDLPEAIDFESSFYVICSGLSAGKIEGMLHSIFSQYNVKKPRADGYTEWFSMECFEQVKQFLISNQQHLNISEPQKLIADAKEHAA